MTSSKGLSLPLPINQSIIQGSGIGPCCFLAYIADLQPKHIDTVYCKFADDLTALIREDSRATDEIKHILESARINKLTINIKKTKEIVLRRARSRRFVIPPPVNGIEQVESVKLLGVTFNSRFSFTPHIDFIAATCSQRFYLLKQMRSQGLDKKGEQIIFNALVVSRIMYASQAYNGYLCEYDIAKLQAILNKAYRYKIIANKMDIKQMFEAADAKLFSAITRVNSHCLQPMLLPKPVTSMQLRSRGHNFQLPNVETELHKLSYLVRCLYKYV